MYYLVLQCLRAHHFGVFIAQFFSSLLPLARTPYLFHQLWHPFLSSFPLSSILSGKGWYEMILRVIFHSPVLSRSIVFRMIIVHYTNSYIDFLVAATSNPMHSNKMDWHPQGHLMYVVILFVNEFLIRDFMSRHSSIGSIYFGGVYSALVALAIWNVHSILRSSKFSTCISTCVFDGFYNVRFLNLLQSFNQTSYLDLLVST